VDVSSQQRKRSMEAVDGISRKMCQTTTSAINKQSIELTREFVCPEDGKYVSRTFEEEDVREH